MNPVKVTFPGGKRVDAEYNGFTHKTDQPVMGGGEGSAPAPFDLFLASLATCAGIYVLSFCQQRNISTEGLSIEQHMDWDPATHRIGTITLKIKVPEGFPPRYQNALAQAAGLCAVKKHMEQAPDFHIEVR